MTHVAYESKLRSTVGHACIHAQEPGWQSGMWVCILLGLPTHLVLELNVGTVHSELKLKTDFICNKIFCDIKGDNKSLFIFLSHETNVLKHKRLF